MLSVRKGEVTIAGETGRFIELEALLADGPVAIMFHRGHWCPYCRMAKELLNRKKVAFTEIDLDREPDARATMIDRAHGRTSVPQIFIGKTHVGGCDDLHALEASGRLDTLLKTGV